MTTPDPTPADRLEAFIRRLPNDWINFESAVGAACDDDDLDRVRKTADALDLLACRGMVRLQRLEDHLSAMYLIQI